MKERIQKIKILTSKGNISGVVHYPKKQTERLAILCPGYLDSKDYKHLIGLAEELSNQGYTVARFDPIGTWESDGNISDYTMTQYLEDIKSVLEYMLQQEDYKHILIGGHSRGGQVSLLYATRDSRVSIVLGIMPPSICKISQKYEEWKKSGFRISRRDLPDDENNKREYKTPYSYFKDLSKYSVLEDVKKIKIPMILIAGELDDKILPEDVKEVFDNANEPKKFIIISNIGHDYRHNDNNISMVNKKIIEQLKSIKL